MTLPFQARAKEKDGEKNNKDLHSIRIKKRIEKNVCIGMTGSVCSSAEIDTTLYINYTLILKKIKIK